MTLLSTDPLFDEQATRTLAHAVHGGADFGLQRMFDWLDATVAGR
jgi:hypothetical protein